VLARDFACWWALSKKCVEFYKEQTLFKGHLMKMARTCSKIVKQLKSVQNQLFLLFKKADLNLNCIFKIGAELACGP
jgi:hypothetical protein